MPKAVRLQQPKRGDIDRPGVKGIQALLPRRSAQGFFASAGSERRLEIGAPDSAYEQDANRMADQAMSAPGPIAPLAGRGDNRALSVRERAFFEPRFGHDFSRVRIHSDPRSAEMADAIDAQAFTSGNSIYFGQGNLKPRLLAHELAHVVQQQAHGGAPRIQRQPVTGARSTVPIFDIGGSVDAPRQTRSSAVMGGVNIPLSYDPATSEFKPTFQLAWKFPHTWTGAQRTDYVQAFVTAVKRVWNNKFQLSETQAPNRVANVQLDFNNFVTPQLATAAEEQAELRNNLSGRWKMDVGLGNVTVQVDRGTSTVDLATGSNAQTPRRAQDLRRNSPFSFSDSGGNRTFQQSASAHEFGHMIGLGDEYLEDSGQVVPSALRGIINDRVMNVGENVTPDAYQPFAEWLSGLTGTTWRVGRRVP